MHVMRVIARCMIRNKTDSYCQAFDLDTTGIQDVVRELADLYTIFGERAGTRAFSKARGTLVPKSEWRATGFVRRLLGRLLRR